MQAEIYLEEEHITADPGRQLHFIKWKKNVQELQQLNVVTLDIQISRVS